MIQTVILSRDAKLETRERHCRLTQHRNHGESLGLKNGLYRSISLMIASANFFVVPDPPRSGVSTSPLVNTFSSEE